MQDRFKFRLYDKAIGEMAYDVCIGFIKDSGKTDDWVCADTSCGQITYRDDKLKDIVLMQCTGIKDTNGKLIYEGDIIEIMHSMGKKAVVYWDNEKCCFKLKGKGIAYNALITIRNDYFEIIGNIYENPELLEQL